jgi:hypothetical protein
MRYQPRTPGGFAVVRVELLFSLTNVLRVRKREGAARTEPRLVDVFDILNSPILSFGAIRISFRRNLLGR